MTKFNKITDEDIKQGLAENKTIVQIGQAYEVSPVTVLSMIQKMERKGEKVRRREPTPGIFVPSRRFDLRIGDVITAIELEISKQRNAYRVIYISKSIYIGAKISGEGSWCAAFRVDDYLTNHDSHLVRKERKRKAHE